MCKFSYTAIYSRCSCSHCDPPQSSVLLIRALETTLWNQLAKPRPCRDCRSYQLRVTIQSHHEAAHSTPDFTSSLHLQLCTTDHFTPHSRIVVRIDLFDPMAEDCRTLDDGSVELAARTGTSFILKKGQRLSIIDPQGKQVSDVAAYNAADIRETLSKVEHSTTLERST